MFRKSKKFEDDKRCFHDWEDIKNIEGEDLLKKEYGDRISNYYISTIFTEPFWYISFWIDGNRISIKGLPIMSQKVCLLCGKCVDESILFMEKVKGRVKGILNRKEFAKKLWKECKNVN